MKFITRSEPEHPSARQQGRILKGGNNQMNDNCSLFNLPLPTVLRLYLTHELPYFQFMPDTLQKILQINLDLRKASGLLFCRSQN